jgi:eukaryotic-like serine/threonine-protein kinase
VAASVLGEEAGRSAISAVSELAGALDDALSELVSANLLAEARRQPEPLYRFRHAVIREATYRGLLRSEGRQLHARAAWHLEANAADRLDEVSAVLGRHFAAAGEDERAVHYFEVAADHANQIFANEEAIALYRQALDVIGLSDRNVVAEPAAARRAITAARLCEKLTDILTLIDRFAEARSAALAGLAVVRPEETFQAARLRYLLGKVEFQTGRYDAAMAAFVASEELIGVPGPDDDQEWVDLWLVLQLTDKIDIYAHRNELERCAALIEAVRPLAEARASGQVAAFFYRSLAGQHLRERRHRIDAQILTEFQRAVDAASAPEQPVLGFMRPERSRISLMMYLGIALTWHGDLSDARRVLEQALAVAESEGSPGARAAALVELAITAFRSGDTETVRGSLPEARAASEIWAHPYYLASAIGLEAWVAWRDERFEEALALGAQSLELWQAHPELYPYCLALWPLAGSYLNTGQVEPAIGVARQLLAPSQARLPDELGAAVHAACEAWDGTAQSRATDLLAGAVTLARSLGYA